MRHKSACSEERGTILLKFDTLNSCIFYRTGLSSIYSTWMFFSFLSDSEATTSGKKAFWSRIKVFEIILHVLYLLIFLVESINCDVWQDEHQESSESSSLRTESSSGSQDGSLSDDSDSLSGSSFTTSVHGPHFTGKVNLY